MAIHPPIEVLAPPLRLPVPEAGALAGSRSARIDRALAEVLALYPEPLRSAEGADVARQRFHLAQVFRPGARIADLGGGIGLLSPSCAALGMEAWSNREIRPQAIVGIHRHHAAADVPGRAYLPIEARLVAVPWHVKDASKVTRCSRM